METTDEYLLAFKTMTATIIFFIFLISLIRPPTTDAATDAINKNNENNENRYEAEIVEWP